MLAYMLTHSLSDPLIQTSTLQVIQSDNCKHELTECTFKGMDRK